jgi:hypothetical protein
LRNWTNGLLSRTNVRVVLQLDGLVERERHAQLPTR